MSTNLLSYNDERFVGLEDFPPVRFDSFDHNVETHIAQYLRDFFKKNTPSGDSSRESSQLVIPSILDLSMYFHCHEFDILDTIETLRRHGYDCEVRDFYKPIKVKTTPAPVYQLRRIAEEVWNGFCKTCKQLASSLRPRREPGEVVGS